MACAVPHLSAAGYQYTNLVGNVIWYRWRTRFANVNPCKLSVKFQQSGLGCNLPVLVG